DGTAAALAVTVSGLTITGGRGTSGAAGGAIFAGNENVTVLDANLANNAAAKGGAIALAPGGGTLTVRNCTLSGNTANGIFTTNGGGGGGGVYIPQGGN